MWFLIKGCRFGPNSCRFHTLTERRPCFLTMAIIPRHQSTTILISGHQAFTWEKILTVSRTGLSYTSTSVLALCTLATKFWGSIGPVDICVRAESVRGAVAILPNYILRAEILDRLNSLNNQFSFPLTDVFQKNMKELKYGYIYS